MLDEVRAEAVDAVVTAVEKHPGKLEVMILMIHLLDSRSVH
jgi:hypothetical protein